MLVSQEVDAAIEAKKNACVWQIVRVHPKNTKGEGSLVESWKYINALR